MISKILKFLFSVFLCLHHWIDVHTEGTETTFKCTECGKKETRKLSDMY
jgi:hypothetical protein